jgi:hypothetical protein
VTRRSAGGALRLVAWSLLVAGLGVIALNPGVPSVQYAIFWAGVTVIARGMAMLAPLHAVGIDLALLVVCFFGLEIGGLIMVPVFVAFAIADAVEPHRATDN